MAVWWVSGALEVLLGWLMDFALLSSGDTQIQQSLLRGGALFVLVPFSLCSFNCRNAASVVGVRHALLLELSSYRVTCMHEWISYGCPRLQGQQRCWYETPGLGSTMLQFIHNMHVCLIA
jgi:hypothetical protein